MRLTLDLGRALACLIFSGLLVLLVPSAAWSEHGEVHSSEPSPSSSPVSESASPSPDPLSSEPSSPSSSGPESSPSGPSDPALVEEPTPTADPTPSDAETVYVVQEPPPETAAVEGEPVPPTEVALSTDDRALLGLTACLLALGVGARIVGSFS